MEAAGASLLAQSLLERISPVILLLPTPSVEESCKKNNLNFLQILHPFCNINQIDVPVRTAGEQPYRIQEFRLRMLYASGLCQPTVENAEEYLLKIVNTASDEALAEIPGDPRDLESIKRMVRSESLSSWFQRYIKTFTHSLAFFEHESIDHPVACLRAVSSTDENPIHKFVELYDSYSMPSFLTDGTMDPKLLKIYVLVHDLQDGPVDGANDILSEMRATFGFNNCWLMCINSESSEIMDSVGEEFWRSHALPALPTTSIKDAGILTSETKLGCFLSETDLTEISDLIAQICCKSILPYMEQKIRSLNQQVVATRKGLKNQIKNLWWRKGKDEVADSNSNAIYTFSSIESEIRVLADYAFMLHDYELALSNYRLISSDFKTDKAWKHYAGAQEMIGLSLFMLDHARKEAELSMETAFSTYQKLVPGGQRLSTRCALWWSEMYKARGQHKEAAGVYFRAGTEEPHLRAGIFLEQAAYCYLRATPPMLRKYGFYLVLAGNRYNVCGQKKHALRAYMSVLTIFEGHGWSYINDHVMFNLGRLSAYLGDHATAVQHFKKLISCSHQSPTNQASFLREFLQAVQNVKQDTSRMLCLDLPYINKNNVRVHFEDQRTYASPAASMLPEDIWLPLEEGIVPAIQTGANNWLNGGSSTAEVNDSNQCVAGETLTVDVEFINPLQIPLNLSSIALICKFCGGSSDAKEEAVDATISSSNGTDSTLSAVNALGLKSDGGNNYFSDDENPSITVVEESLTMKAGEKYTAHLKVIPHEKGVLSIMGVKWTLNGVVRGYQQFIQGMIKARTKKSRRDKFHVQPPHRRLKFIVNQHMPRLEVSLHGMPEKINSGELHRVVLELSNTSDVAIKNMKFCTNQPGILLVGNMEDLDAEFPNCLEHSATENLQCAGEVISETNVRSSIYTFPETTILEGGSTLLWPLWLHGRELGILLLNNILYYESNKKTSGLLFRTVRMSHTLQIFPSLGVAVNISPCLLKLEQYLLRMDIANLHSTESFWLRQVSCIGNRWQISPLLQPMTSSDSSKEEVGGLSHSDAAFLSASLAPSQLLPASQTLSLFFHLMDVDRKEDSINQQGGFVSNIRLGSPSSNEPLINVLAGPIFKFHRHERMSKDKEFKDALNAEPLKILENELDIILISEQQNVTSSGKSAAFQDGQRLATHHVCHSRVKQSSPVVWIMEGPTTIAHDFSSTPCEVAFSLTIKNVSRRPAQVKVDMSSVSNTAANSTVLKQAQNNLTGWYDISLETNPSSVSKQMDKDSSLEVLDINSPAPPLLWTSLNCFKIDRLCSGETENYTLQLCVFAPGVYDLSGYHVSWELLSEEDDAHGLSIKDEETRFSATQITLSSAYMEVEANQKKESTDVDIISGSGCGHTLILNVEDKREFV